MLYRNSLEMFCSYHCLKERRKIQIITWLNKILLLVLHEAAVETLYSIVCIFLGSNFASGGYKAKDISLSVSLKGQVTRAAGCTSSYGGIHAHMWAWPQRTGMEISRSRATLVAINAQSLYLIGKAQRCARDQTEQAWTPNFTKLVTCSFQHPLCASVGHNA